MSDTSLRSLANGASPGPWVAHHKDGSTSAHVGEVRIAQQADGEYEHRLATVYCGGFTGHGYHNAQFIAAARTAIPELLDRLEKIEKDLAEACELARCIADAGDDRYRVAIDGHIDRIAAIEESTLGQEAGE